MGLLFHVGLHLGVLAADDDGLGGLLETGEAVEHAGGGADAERAAGDEKERPGSGRSRLAGGARRGFRGAEEGVDGDAADGDVARRGGPRTSRLDLAFLERDEVAIEGLAEPHGVDVEVGHDDGEARVEFSLLMR